MARKRKEPKAYCGGHPTAVQISDYERNAWPAEQEKALTRHVSACSVCRNDPRVRRAFVIQLLYIGATLQRGGDLQAAYVNYSAAAEQALLLPDEQDPAEAAALHVEDLRARALCELADVNRDLNDLDEAEELLCEAEDHMEKGSGYPLLGARWHDVAGSLFRDQCRFDEALQALRWARTLYLENGAELRAARCLMKLGTVYLAKGKPRRAVNVLIDAVRELGQANCTDRRLILAATHNLFLALVEAGVTDGLGDLLRQWRRPYRTEGTPLLRNRRLGLEARVAAGTGRHRRAERLFRFEIAWFQKAGHLYDAALVSLRLAKLLVEWGRPAADILALLDGAVAAFVEQEIYRELIMSFELLRGAVQAEQATAQAIARFAEDLRTVHSRPVEPL
jgi:tetratricopeptide (TPR) repeat protein